MTVIDGDPSSPEYGPGGGLKRAAHGRQRAHIRARHQAGPTPSQGGPHDRGREVRRQGRLLQAAYHLHCGPGGIVMFALGGAGPRRRPRRDLLGRRFGRRLDQSSGRAAKAFFVDLYQPMPEIGCFHLSCIFFRALSWVSSPPAVTSFRCLSCALMTSSALLRETRRRTDHPSACMSSSSLSTSSRLACPGRASDVLTSAVTLGTARWTHFSIPDRSAADPVKPTAVRASAHEPRRRRPARAQRGRGGQARATRRGRVLGRTSRALHDQRPAPTAAQERVRAVRRFRWVGRASDHSSVELRACVPVRP